MAELRLLQANNPNANLFLFLSPTVSWIKVMWMKSLKDAVTKAVNEYNRYRSPEAKAKLVKLSEKELILDFEGSFCRTCGVYDYLEDFIYELEKFVDVDVKIKSFKEFKPETIRVKYSLKMCKNKEGY